MDLNDQQKEAVAYQGEAKNILVTAGAGCGKTRTITARTVNLVQSGRDASRILMMTFTNRAAREMKTRLKSEIGPVSNQVHTGTFHSFCLKAMSNVPRSFGVSGLNIIDSDDQKSLMAIVRNRYIKEGMKSFDESMGMHINPYESGSIRYNEFELGWIQALMRSFDQVSKKYRAEAIELQQKEFRGKKPFRLIQFK